MCLTASQMQIMPDGIADADYAGGHLLMQIFPDGIADAKCV
jgi:hypothetical protein